MPLNRTEVTDMEERIVQKPVNGKAGGPYSCKECPPKHLFSILVERGMNPPQCPNCKKLTTFSGKVK